MNTLFEFQDSEVQAVTWADGTLTIRFSAAFVREEQAPTPRIGYLSGVSLSLRTPQPPAGMDTALGSLASGYIEVAGSRNKMLPLPGKVSGPLRLVLNFHRGGVLQVEAQELEATSNAPGSFVESFAC